MARSQWPFRSPRTSSPGAAKEKIVAAGGTVTELVKYSRPELPRGPSGGNGTERAPRRRQSASDTCVLLLECKSLLSKISASGLMNVTQEDVCFPPSCRPSGPRTCGGRSSSLSASSPLYRVGAALPSPGVDYGNVQKCIEHVSGGDNAGIYQLINLFSGGALLHLSVFAIGIMPYITACIIVQLLRVVIPHFEELSKEGQSGQAKLTQYTRYLSIALAVLQATGLVALAARGQLLQGCTLPILADTDVFGLIIIVLVMTVRRGLRDVVR